MADKHQHHSKEEVEEKEPEQKEIPKELKELFHWKSPARPFKKRNRRFYVNLGLMLLVIALIALFVQEFFLLAVLIAVFFYYYIAGTVEPISIDHRITNRGITTAEHTYEWSDLTDFWFTGKFDDTVLYVSTKKRFPPRLVMLVPYKDQEKVKKILVEHLTFQEHAPVTWIDNAIEWFTAKLPASMR